MSESQMIAENKWQPVSFVIPAHNEEKYLPETLACLFESADKIGLQFEIIVVNDGSTDDTEQVVHEFKDSNRGNANREIRLHSVNLRNIGAVRNAGAEQARYDWLCFVDADTHVSPAVLEQAANALAEGCVGGGAGVKLDRTRRVPFFKWLMFLGVRIGWQVLGRWAAGCFMFCQKASFDEFGGFDEDYFAAEELFFSRNLKRRGKFKLVSASVVTSARKLHAYSVWELLRFLTIPFIGKGKPLQTKKGLEVLYEDDRR